MTYVPCIYVTIRFLWDFKHWEQGLPLPLFLGFWDPIPHTVLSCQSKYEGRYLVLQQLDEPCLVYILERQALSEEMERSEWGQSGGGGGTWKREEREKCSLEINNNNNFIEFLMNSICYKSLRKSVAI